MDERRAAELAGVPWFDNYDEWEATGCPRPYIQDEGHAGAFYVELGVRVAWSLTEKVSRAWIADRLMQGPNWPDDWVLWGNSVCPLEEMSGEIGDPIAECETPSDAVIAAMEEVGK